MKSVRIRSFSGPYFPAFELNTERLSLCIQFECRKMRTRKTPNTDNFQAVCYIQIFYHKFLFMPGFALNTIIRKTNLLKKCTSSIILNPSQIIKNEKMACKIYIALLRNLFQIYFPWLVRFPYFPCMLDATDTSF